MKTVSVVPVPGFPGYFVSATGDIWSERVRGSKTGSIGPLKPLKPKTSHTGYFCVNLYRERNRPERQFIHALVLLAYVGPRPEGMLIRHLNGDQKDNRLANLSYGTKAENMQDAIKHGDAPVGQDHYKAKLTNDQVREIRSLAASGMSRREIGARFDVGHHYVTKIVCREIWKHV